MKRILILNYYVATLGGGEKLMAYFCRFFELYFNHDVQIDIMIPSYKNTDEDDKDFISINDVMRRFDVQLEHTSIKRVNFSIPNSRMKKIKHWFEIENSAKGYDLFINLTFLSRHRGKARKNIYECMFPPPKFEAAFNRNPIKSIASMLCNFLFFRSYDAFISISDFSRSWLETYWGKSSKYETVYPPVFSEESLSGRYNEKKKRNIIVSVGRFFVDAHCKNQLEMVQFFTNNPDVFTGYEFHLVGSVSTAEKDVNYLAHVKELADKSDNVFIHENYSYEELTKMYEQAKVFWHATGYGTIENEEPEKAEHFGITTVEAMSYGVVPVVVNKGGQPEIVDDCINAFLWNNEVECVDKTNELIQNEAMRKEMALRAVMKAKAFSVEAFYRRNKEVFDELKI